MVFKGDAKARAIRPVVVGWWRIRSQPRELLLYTGSLGGRQSIERERGRRTRLVRTSVFIYVVMKALPGVWLVDQLRVRAQLVMRLWDEESIEARYVCSTCRCMYVSTARDNYMYM